MATVATAAPKSNPWPKTWQLGLLALPLLALAVLFLVRAIQKPDYTRLLWTDPMGVKMLAAVAGSLLIGAILYLGGCVVLNLITARSAWGMVASVIQVGFVAVWVLIFCVPVAFVILNGPAAIQMQRNLSAN